MVKDTSLAANITVTEWDGLLAGLDAGRYDIMVNGVEIMDERADKYDFTDPYAYIRTAIIVNGDNGEIQTYDYLTGKTTANTIPSTYAELAESFGAGVSCYDYMKAHPESN